jgi:hypothetical protein
LVVVARKKQRLFASIEVIGWSGEMLGVITGSTARGFVRAVGADAPWGLPAQVHAAQISGIVRR